MKLSPVVTASASSATSWPQVAELNDVNDFVCDSCLPTANLITITVHPGRHGSRTRIREAIEKGARRMK